MITAFHLLVTVSLACASTGILVVSRLVLILEPGMYGMEQVAALSSAFAVVAWLWLVAAFYTRMILGKIDEARLTTVTDRMMRAVEDEPGWEQHRRERGN